MGVGVERPQRVPFALAKTFVSSDRVVGQFLGGWQGSFCEGAIFGLHFLHIGLGILLVLGSH